MRLFHYSAALLALSTGAAFSASVTLHTSQASFENALDGSFTFIDFDTFVDTSPLTAGDARLTAFGLDVITADTRGFTTQPLASYPSNQGPGPNVTVLFNGSGTVSRDDDFAVNFTGGANGFGYAGNLIDGGIIEFYSEEDLAGTLLGSVSNDGSGNFSGGVLDMTFASARITCDFNFDYTCGVTDLQFGTIATTPVPLPAGLPLLFGAITGIASLKRLRTKLG